MAIQINSKSVRDAYNRLIKLLKDAPIHDPRGKKTKELLSVTTEIENPRNRLFYNSKRKFNPAFAIAETIAHLTGINNTKYFDTFNSNMKNFSDNGVNFYGNYGVRITKYIERVVEKLQNNPDTRQAVVTIYNTEDSFAPTKDVPCTLNLDFKLRDNKLYLHTFMRSNDLVWGYQYDVFCFTLIQEIIANELNVELGSYTHTATSMHVYERHWDLIEKMKDELLEIEMEPISQNLQDMYDTALEAMDVAHKNHTSEMVLNWMVAILKDYAYRKSHKNCPRLQLPEWYKRFYRW